MRRKAVLLIHGFTGAIYDLEELANFLELNKKLDVYTYTLPGHDTKKKNATMEKWLASADYQIQRLINNGYKKIYVIGHSMGGVLATYLAAKYKEVKKVVLLAAAFKYFFANEKTLFGKIKDSTEALASCSHDAKKNFFTKLPPKAFHELKELVDKHQGDLENIKVPILIMQGAKDKIVPATTAFYIFDKVNTNKRQLVLINGFGHGLFRDTEHEKLDEIVERFLTKWSFMIKEEKKEI